MKILEYSPSWQSYHVVRSKSDFASSSAPPLLSSLPAQKIRWTVSTSFNTTIGGAPCLEECSLNQQEIRRTHQTWNTQQHTSPKPEYPLRWCDCSKPRRSHLVQERPGLGRRRCSSLTQCCSPVFASDEKKEQESNTTWPPLCKLATTTSLSRAV